ncbi:Fic family protein [Candidatus Paracaedibacter symbiosus]|uniref:Fic family protein n=1 Tax=Candidatus Paracaedibacter symbiosus TaxID=244582 RepID=UPI0005096F46|nr:Fic family protein [Candidatus Paracaedibacter symbiosus]
MRVTGIYQRLGDLNYFIPYPLPPSNPPFEISVEIVSLYGEASFALGQLNEMSMRLPDPKRFIKAYVIKEALLSSSIEGIHTTLIDIFTYSLGESKPTKDTQLVLNYTKALDVALMMLKDEGIPLATRVILKTHEALMSAGEGDKSTPGFYRKQSVRVGEHIPPPAAEIEILMSAFEKYINESTDLPPLIRAGLAHVQFETIHPFLDGNGRIGRLLIVLMMIDSGLLHLPILYPSYYFKKHHLEYYQTLDRVRTHGDFESWIVYYLKAIRDSALDAHTRAKEIEALENRLKDLIQEGPHFVKMRETANLVLDYLFTQPVTGIAEISQKLGKAYNTISHILKQFVKLNIVSENIIHKRNKLYRFELYLTLLEKDYS